MSDAFVDPYLYPDSGILKNALSIRDDNELKVAESDIVYAKELLIDEASIPRTNDATELLSIHRFLFEDIYEWAGTIRTVDMAKSDDPEGFFLIKSKINVGLDFIFSELEKDNFLKRLEKEQFVKRIAYFYEQLNFVHPFREGNGRTQRVFWSRVAKDAGYKIDWNEIVGGENNEACRVAARNQNLGLLEKMFGKIVHEL